jgi:hypothetical protein
MDIVKILSGPFGKLVDAGREDIGLHGQYTETMARKEVYCETCGSDQPLIEHEPRKDELNPYSWYDFVCGTCYSIIATIQIVPDDKPLEFSRAVTDKPVTAD